MGLDSSPYPKEAAILNDKPNSWRKQKEEKIQYKNNSNYHLELIDGEVIKFMKVFKKEENKRRKITGEPNTYEIT